MFNMFLIFFKIIFKVNSNDSYDFSTKMFNPIKFLFIILLIFSISTNLYFIVIFHKLHVKMKLECPNVINNKNVKIE